jgi:hypothetical protein
VEASTACGQEGMWRQARHVARRVCGGKHGMWPGGWMTLRDTMCVDFERFVSWLSADRSDDALGVIRGSDRSEAQTSGWHQLGSKR